MFSEIEYSYRRQFFDLFCGGQLSIVRNPADAINTDKWYAQNLLDILHDMYPHNELTKTDVTTIMAVAGMAKEGDGVWVREGVNLSKHLAVLLRHRVTPKASLRLYELVSGKTTNNIVEFYHKFCSDPNVPVVRVRAQAVYQDYANWCLIRQYIPSGRNVFYERFKALGQKYKKRYFDGTCGVNCYELHYTGDKEFDYEQERQEKTEQEKGQQLWDNFEKTVLESRARDEVPPNDLTGGTQEVLGSEETYRDGEHAGYVAELEQDDISDDSGDARSAGWDADGNPDNADGDGAIDLTEDRYSEDGRDSDEFGNSDTGHRTQGDDVDSEFMCRIKQAANGDFRRHYYSLPKCVRDVMYLFKTDRKISPENFSEDWLRENLISITDAYIDMDIIPELLEIFYTYCDTDMTLKED